MTKRRWPFPGDLPVDRARQVALQYQRALINVDTTAAQCIDEAARLAGESWPGLGIETSASVAGRGSP